MELAYLYRECKYYFFHVKQDNTLSIGKKLHLNVLKYKMNRSRSKV